MTRQILVVVASVVLSQTAVGQESRPALPPAPPPPGAPAADDPDAMQPRLALNVPQVIVPSDIARYGKMLGLSEEQQGALERMYIAYREDCDKLNREQMPPIARLSSKCGAARPEQQDWDWFEDYEEFWTRQVAYMKEMFRREDAMFAELVPLLAEDQFPRLPRVQMHRQRNRCTHYSMIPGARIDLTSLIEKSRLPEETLEAIDPTMAEYEAALTPAIVKLQRIDDRQTVEEIRLGVEFFFEIDGSKVDQKAPESAARFRGIQEQREKLLSASARAQQQVADVNRQFARRVLDLIPEPERKPVDDEYLHLMHPYVYPDNCDPKQMFDAIVQSDGLDPDLRDALQAMWGIYRQSYDSLTRQMIEATDKTYEQLARSFAGLSDSMRPEWKLRADRWDKSIEFIDSVMNQLPPDLQNELALRVKEYKQRSEMYRAMAEHRSNPPQVYQPPKPAPK